MFSSASLSSSERFDSRNAPVYQSVIRNSYDQGCKRSTLEDLVRVKSVLVNVEQLLFTQDSIARTFRGRYQNNQIHDTLSKFFQGKMTVSDFPNLEVVCHEGHLWSLDNRRLWIFKKANISQVVVNIVPFDHHPRFQQAMKNPALKQMLLQKDFLPRVRGKYRNKFNVQRSVYRPVSDRRSSSSPTPEAGPKPFPPVHLTNRKPPLLQPIPAPRPDEEIPLFPSEYPARNGTLHVQGTRPVLTQYRPKPTLIPATPAANAVNSVGTLVHESRRPLLPQYPAPSSSPYKQNFTTGTGATRLPARPNAVIIDIPPTVSGRSRQQRAESFSENSRCCSSSCLCCFIVVVLCLLIWLMCK